MCVLFCAKNNDERNKQTAEETHIMSSDCGKLHLLSFEILHPPYECQVETDSKAVLEEEGGSATVQLSFGDDGDAVAQQVGFVHVMSGQNHSPACRVIQLLIKCFLLTCQLDLRNISSPI